MTTKKTISKKSAESTPRPEVSDQDLKRAGGLRVQAHLRAGRMSSTVDGTIIGNECCI